MAALPDPFPATLTAKSGPNGIPHPKGSLVDHRREVVLKDGGFSGTADGWQSSDRRLEAPALSKREGCIARESIAGELSSACPKDSTKRHPIMAVVVKGRKPRKDVRTVTVGVGGVLNKHLLVETGAIKHLFVAQIRLEHLRPDDYIGAAILRVGRAIGT